MAQDALGSSAHVAVVGGGCAGLAAAARLAESGIRVTLFEAGSNLGGRARSVTWKGLQLDNGQHILLGAYQATLTLLQLVGVKPDEALLRLPLHLRILNRFELCARHRLTAPLHVVAGVLLAQGLSLRERLAILRFMAWMRFSDFRLPADEPLSRLLARRKQPANAIELLWEPLCLAALNTPLQDASAQVFLNVLRDSFAGARHASDLLLPRRDLGRLLAEPAAAYIERNRGSVVMHAPVLNITRANDKFMLKTAEQHMEFSHVVIAVSPSRAAELIAEMPSLSQVAAMCNRYRHQPIYTIYLQYDPMTRLPAAMLGLAPPNHAQWLFDRGQLCMQHGLIAAVISAEGRHQQMTQQALAEAVAQEIAQAFPAFPAPVWHKVIAEKRATFACTPDLARPGNVTAVPGLYLAGDYTAGDYPATIEGAIRSGATCARHIIHNLSWH